MLFVFLFAAARAVSTSLRRPSTWLARSDVSSSMAAPTVLDVRGHVYASASPTSCCRPSTSAPSRSFDARMASTVRSAPSFVLKVMPPSGADTVIEEPCAVMAGASAAAASRSCRRTQHARKIMMAVCIQQSLIRLPGGQLLYLSS